jgi:ABC-type bacteriocin/lantibiotic exporter with double-glycine peptidase domain
VTSLWCAASAAIFLVTATPAAAQEVRSYMITNTLTRRLVQAVLALATWVAAAAGVMWFYDWVARWYVVVAVLLFVVTGAVLIEATRPRAEKSAELPG